MVIEKSHWYSGWCQLFFDLHQYQSSRYSGYISGNPSADFRGHSPRILSCAAAGRWNPKYPSDQIQESGPLQEYVFASSRDSIYNPDRTFSSLASIPSLMICLIPPETRSADFLSPAISFTIQLILNFAFHWAPCIGLVFYPYFPIFRIIF